jgi:hypothetical protein
MAKQRQQSVITSCLVTIPWAAHSRLTPQMNNAEHGTTATARVCGNALFKDRSQPEGAKVAREGAKALERIAFSLGTL